MKILFLARWFPFPASHGAKIRTFNLIEQLAARHEVALASFTDGTTTAEHIAEMRKITPRIETVLYRDFQPTSLRALTGYLGRRPRSVKDTYSREFAEIVKRLAAETQCDAIVASSLDMALYPLEVPHTPRVLEEIEIGAIKNLVDNESNAGKRLRKTLNWRKWQAFTADMIKQYDAATTVSESELALIQSSSPNAKNVHVVTNGADLKRLTGNFAEAEPDTLIYTGSLTYYVNFEAMKWFLAQVFPLIRAERPAVRLLMAGSQHGVPMHELPADPNAQHVGHLPDVRPFVQRGWALIVPEHLGGGTRIKVLESMALGTPIVAVGNSVRGLQVTPGCDVLVAESPRELADAILKLLGDPALRQMLSKNGRALIEARYDWAVIGQQLSAIVEHAVKTYKTTTPA
jgi:polysaccharide biosynthesis protein PslH